MTMVYEQAVVDTIMPSPGSPPGLTASKSSKSSSFHSISSDDNSVLSDVNHFEDIGLDDDTLSPHSSGMEIKSYPKRFSPPYSSDIRTTTLQYTKTPRAPTRELARVRSRDVLAKARPAFPSLQTQVRSANVRSTSTSALVPEPFYMKTKQKSPFPSRSTSLSFRPRTPSPTNPSPNFSLGMKTPAMPVVLPRRGSWQSTSSRKSAMQLELECDEDEGDDIPDGLILDNVPISPRPASERSHPISPISSKANSPDRTPKEKSRSVGNGTPPVAAARGSLRSPTWKSDAPKSPTDIPSSPIKMRAKSWTAVLSDLNTEAKDLTAKLEEHADEVQLRLQRSSTGSMPVRRVVTDPMDNKPRHKSALPELPPLRRTNIMIDPLPVSKEKEAVLSRTRPSWLPPKDPAEEKRHLREYKKMMAHSAEAERRRESEKRARTDNRDTTVSTTIQIWENDILPRWPEAIRERRTRELWWRGIAPRSRGVVWARAIGNELGLTEASFHAALGRARQVDTRANTQTGSAEDLAHAAIFTAIRKDVEEHTWKDLRIFQAGAPLHQGLMDVLMAYCMYRSDIGYVTGCNTIAALLLLNLPGPASAFVALANLLNRPLPLSFYASDLGAKATAYNLLLQSLSQKAPALYYHITNFPDHDPDYYLNSLFTSLFTSHLALDQAARLWDVYVFEGDAILVNAAMAFIMEREMALLGAKSLIEARDILLCSNDGAKNQKIVAQLGEEVRWMKAVKQASKA